MKKIVIAIITSIIFFTSCEDYFKNKPNGSYNEDDFYKNINELQNALDAVYSVIREKSYQLNLALIGDGMSDDFVYEYSMNQDFGYDAYRLCTFKATSDNTTAREWYSINYRGIFRANMLLKHVNDSLNLWYREGADDSNIRMWQSIYGQALFLRAYFYFNLVRSYGDVPIMPLDPNYKTYNIPRSSKDLVYAYIEKDLRTAAILLPIKYDSNDQYGAATRYAALSYLMKVIIYQAKPGIPSQKWDEAQRLGALLTGYNEDVNMTFKEILKPELNFPGWSWDSLKIHFKFDKRIPFGILSGTQMSELKKPIENAIFQKSSDINTTQGFVDWGKMWRLSFQSLEKNHEPIFFIPTIDLKGISVNNTYNYVDYLYGSYYFYSPALVPTMSLVKEIDPVSGDLRRYYGVVSHNMNPIGHFSSDLAGESMGGLGVENNYYQCIKRWLHSQNERQISPWVGSLRIVMLMRYSEVVLLYAEALNESGNSKAAIDVLNKMMENFKNNSPSITSDVPATDISDFKYAPYSTVRELIYHERRMELFAEFDRFFDIVRQGRAESLLNYAFKIDNSYSKQGTFIRGKNEVLPIPQNEIDLSHGVIVLNPGY